MKPILFNTEMVRAILEGRKTCTRRAVKPQWILPIREVSEIYDGWEPPYRPGDILYVREKWAHPSQAMIQKGANPDKYIYCADFPATTCGWLDWKSPAVMPKEAARLFLRVTGVRAERLQDITEAGALSEGVHPSRMNYGIVIQTFSEIWNDTIKKADLSSYGWAANPWVWVIEFERAGEKDVK